MLIYELNWSLNCRKHKRRKKKNGAEAQSMRHRLQIPLLRGKQNSTIGTVPTLVAADTHIEDCTSSFEHRRIFLSQSATCRPRLLPLRLRS